MRTKFIMLALRYENLNILLLRRTLKELRENHIAPMLKTLNGLAKYNKTEGIFEFPTGSRIICGYCDTEADAARYQGHEYDVIGFEEATNFTEQMYQDLILCNRTSKPGFVPRAYYTCNPGGVGHAWVKRIFIDREYREAEQPDDYMFIPANIYDNYVIMDTQPDYVRMLEALPEDKRRALLLGDWDVYEGQYFQEFRRDIHVIEPFAIPDHWRRYRAMDYGLDMLACLWAAFDELGNGYIYSELCEPELIVSAAAQGILDQSTGKELVTYAPMDMWGRNRASGKAQAEIFADSGLTLSPVRSGRVDSWSNLHLDPPGISGHLLEGRFIFDAFVLGAKGNGVVVLTAPANKAATPVITVGASTTTITSTTSGATIKYTVDGSDPRHSRSAAVYSAAVPNPAAGKQIKAAAVNFTAADNPIYMSDLATKTV